MLNFMPKKVYLWGIMQLKQTELLLRLMATMFSQKQHAEIGLDTSKIMILMLRIKSGQAH